MRFLNTSTLEFCNYTDHEMAKWNKGYAILSHRWTLGDDELLYKDILSLDSNAKAKGGYAKVSGACNLAKRLGYKRLWIDTCCINRLDAVELAETITSMYRRYAESQLCIAYLEDVTSTAQIKESAWFGRGWTLQELIAPKAVRFYDRDWTPLGNKSSLGPVLARKTGIPIDVLRNVKPPQACSVAQRMSWAANRTTTRIEDRAYSLMGLFDVNMHMIYGERQNAFIRLQEHIIAKSTDESIFAWDLDLVEGKTRNAKRVMCGLLATSPACFARCGDVVSTGRSSGFFNNQFGLNISLPATLHTPDLYIAPLQVTKAGSTDRFALLLCHLPERGFYARVSSAAGESYFMTKTVSEKVKLFIIPPKPEGTITLYQSVWLRKIVIRPFEPIHSHKILTRHGTKEPDQLLWPIGRFGTVAIVQLMLQKSYSRPGGLNWIKFGFDSSFSPICAIHLPDPDTDEAKAFEAQSRELLGLELGSPARFTHPIWSGGWARNPPLAVKGSPHHYDSRLDPSSDESGYKIAFRGPLFKIAASARRVHDPGRGEVWAINLVVGTKHVQQQGWGCCCC